MSEPQSKPPDQTYLESMDLTQTITVDVKLESEKLEAKKNNNSISSSSEKDKESDTDLKEGETLHTNLEHNWCLFDPFKRKAPTSPPTSMDDAKELPLANASFLSKMTFWWIQDLLILGAKRSLVAEDLYKMDESRSAGHLADLFEQNFARRGQEIKEWNASIDDGTMNPSFWRKSRWYLYYHLTGFGSPDGKRQVGIALALSDTFFWQFWGAGCFKMVGDLAQVTSPLVTRALIYFVADSGLAYNGVEGYSAPPLSRGIGLVISLFLMQILYSVCTAQMFSRGGQAGILARGALIAAVYRRSMKLSGKSRVVITNSKLVSHISTDISRIDFASSFFHFSWTCALQLIEITIILLTNIGVSALAGIALVVFALPLQTYAMKKLFTLRKKSMIWTDKRIKLISELLLGIRVIKFFAWESPYLDRVHEFRRKEVESIHKLLIIRAANLALAISIPLLSSILVFVTYSFMGNFQSPAVIWTSISLLSLLRLPIMMLPMSLSSITDAHNAMERLLAVFMAEDLEENFLVDHTAEFALHVDNASFEWETSEKTSLTVVKKEVKDRIVEKEQVVEKPSRIENINLEISRGQLVMIVGPVGSGKSSLLQGIIGEMRKTSGTVHFGGRIAYTSQTAWISNSTVRANILFGQPFDEVRYWNCVRDSALLADLDQLPNGDLTEIGEKGIALSGGQRQRVSICRTLYYNSDIVLFDDPLSAVDAHVGQYLMDHVILGALAHKTRIMVTHALSFTSSADHIICMENGKIVECGSHAELIKADGTFARLAREYGGSRNEFDANDTTTEKKLEEKVEVDSNANVIKKSSRLMQTEERSTGSISGKVYKDYLRAGKAYFTAPIILITLILMQSASGVSLFELTWWQDDLFNQSNAFYLGIYAALGILAAIFTFLTGVASVTLGVTASKQLHHSALEQIISAPISYFDTTPIGRMLNRFTKDVDSIDNRLNDSLRLTLVTFASIFGSFLLVAIIQPYFIIAVVLVFIFFYYISKFYRSSAREIKRLDNILRSGLYAHFSESLAGLSTIRAFGETRRFISDNEKYIDIENRAYFLTVINQRYLAIRLDLMGAFLTLIVASISVGNRYSINASQIGLILSSIVGVQQSLSMVVRQSAEVENNLSSVERLHYYATEVEQEAASVIPETEPPVNWPARGSIEFSNVELKYRPGLPSVLHNLSFNINPGEKVGIVGRTGAGKSSILLCLFRIIELTRGSIHVDGIDIATLGTKVLRQRLSIIPQDALLFAGTIRSNLDPFGDHDDATLWSALKRACLVERTGVEGETFQASRFQLDTKIEDEGSNMSVGERSLVSLARALVKDTSIVVLDEATAAVDFENDEKIQATIRTEFKDKTLLCIAHRLRTIINYDRVLVMDAGNIAEFDTPSNLFLEKGIFYGLCIQSGISLEDINRSRDL